jgi:hypothetical protein
MEVGQSQLQLTLGNASIIQGALNNCWLLAALSSLGSGCVSRLLLVLDKSDSGLGRYCFRFYKAQLGGWIEVVVDDWLPLNAHGELLFASSSSSSSSSSSPSSRERDPPLQSSAPLWYFWPSLVEKAYAKLHGGYHSLNGGSEADALCDFTGGTAQLLDVEKMKRQHLEAAQDGLGGGGGGGGGDTGFRRDLFKRLQQATTTPTGTGIMRLRSICGCTAFDAPSASDNRTDPGSAESVIRAGVAVDGPGQPEVALTFTMVEDPATVAARFLADHGLPPESAAPVQV